VCVCVCVCVCMWECVCVCATSSIQVEREETKRHTIHHSKGLGDVTNKNGVKTLEKWNMSSKWPKTNFWHHFGRLKIWNSDVGKYIWQDGAVGRTHVSQPKGRWVQSRSDDFFCYLFCCRNLTTNFIPTIKYCESWYRRDGDACDRSFEWPWWLPQ